MDEHDDQQASHEPSQHREIHFTIDGRPFAVDRVEQTASALLLLAGLDAADYDLAEIRRGHQPKRYEDDDRVHVENGGAFVTIRQRAEVA